MINNKLRKYLKENEFESILLDDPSFDNSIVGLENNGRVIYNLHKMVEEYCIDNCCDEEEALDFIYYDTIRAIPYMGDNRPIIMTYEIGDILND